MKSIIRFVLLVILMVILPFMTEKQVIDLICLILVTVGWEIMDNENKV